MSLIDRYRALIAQTAYRQRVAVLGLPALLEPYRGALPRALGSTGQG